MTDRDNTKERATAYYGDIQFVSVGYSPSRKRNKEEADLFRAGLFMDTPRA